MSTSTSLVTFASLQNDTSATTDLNNNFAAINTSLGNCLALNGQAPNQMQANLDMNNNRLINLPAPASITEPLRLSDATTLNGNGTINITSQLPVGGNVNQMLAKNSATNFDTKWSYPIPTGGTSGQILTKTSNADLDVSWQAFSTSNGIPVGGNTGQFLSKNSAANFDANWYSLNAYNGGQQIVTSSFTLNSTYTGQAINMSGGFFTATIPTPLAMGNINFTCYIVNADSVRGKLVNFQNNVTVNGPQSFILYPYQICKLFITNGQWNVVRDKRWRLPAPPAAGVVLYVDPVNGSNFNDGLSAGGPNALQTLQFAYDTVANNWDLNDQVVTIQITGTAQTYNNNGITAYTPCVGLHDISQLVIDGGGNTLNTNAGGYQFSAGDTGTKPGVGVQFTIQNMIIDSQSGTGGGINASNGGRINIGSGVTFAHSSNQHINLSTNGVINVISGYTITSGATVHVNADHAASFYCNTGLTINITGTCTFSTAFVQANYAGLIAFENTTFNVTGSVTGKRYNVQYNGIINRSATTQTYFPGTAFGTANSGGIYGGVPATSIFLVTPSNYTVPNGTTPIQVPFMITNVSNGVGYSFEADIYTSAADTTGGVKFDLNGTCTTSFFQWDGLVYSNAVIAQQTRKNTLGSPTGTAITGVASYIHIKGYIVPSSDGTFWFEFALNTTSSTSATSVLAGSTLRLTQATPQ